MLKSFALEQPSAIYFGCGKRQELPGVVNRFGKRVLLVTGSTWFAASRWRDIILNLLDPFQVEMLNCPSGEPSSEGLEPLLSRARSLRPEVIVAVGGGSILDTAKAISGLLPRQEPVDDFLEGVGKGLTITAPGIPWIALPTTSGTGAEVTKNAVIKSKALGYKRSLRSSFLLANCVIVDPELTVECSQSLTGAAGLDALTQLIESYVSRKSAPVPRALVRQAFPIMLSALKRLAGDLSDLDARSGAAYGALISGIALANSGLGAAHGFASGLGGLYDIPHGLICAVFLRPVLRTNTAVIGEACLSLYRDAQIYAGAEVRPIDGPGAVAWLIGELDELFAMMQLPNTLREFNVASGDLAEIARRSVGSSMSGNPRDLTQDDLERIAAPLI